MTETSQHKQESFNHRLRRFNKRYFNRFSLGLAGRPGSPWSVIQHRGRVTDRSYTTPVVARAQNGHYVIPLPYGADVDWCQNVLAAGEATVISSGEAYRVDEPEIIAIDEAISAFPDWMQEAAEEAEETQFLRMRRLNQDQGAYDRLEERYPAQDSLAVLAGVLLAGAAFVFLLVRLVKRDRSRTGEEAADCC